MAGSGWGLLSLAGKCPQYIATLAAQKEGGGGHVLTKGQVMCDLIKVAHVPSGTLVRKTCCFSDLCKVSSILTRSL